MGGGRTKFYECFMAMRAILTTGRSAPPGNISNGIREGSKMTATFDLDVGYKLKVEIGFKKMPKFWGEIYVGTGWGAEVVYKAYNGDKLLRRPRKEDEAQYSAVEHIYATLRDDVIGFLDKKCIMTFDEAMEHMGGLPFEILRTLGIWRQDDINDHLAQLMPWLCCFSDDVRGCLVWMDDIFNSIHELIMTNFGESVVNMADDGGAQYVMSCRRSRVFRASDHYPCFYFYHGNVIKLSKKKEGRGYMQREYEYAFKKDDDDYHGWYHYLEEFDNSLESHRLQDDIKNAIGEE